MATTPVLELSQFFLILCLIVLTACFDPYEILGVSRQATGQEIKKAYKRLAREWHPDKNKSPEAEGKFVEISKAYELLTDDDKRRNYDQYGATDDNPQGQQGRGGHGFPFGFSDFFGGRGRPGGGFRGGPFSSFFDSEPDDLLINRHVYEKDILPQSHKQVFLMFAYSDWCGNCKIVRKMFDQLHKMYQDKGIRFVTADADVDRSLIYKLGLSRVPSVLAIVKGKPKLYQRREWSLSSIEQFLFEHIPHVRIHQLRSKQELDHFLDELITENKPRVVIYTDSKAPPNWVKVLAFAKQKSHSFAFVSARDYKDNENEFLGRNGMLSIYVSKESPAETISRAAMYAGTLSLVEKFKLVKFPRLSNHVIFDSICPTVTSISNRKYCVVLVHPDASELEAYSAKIEKMKRSGLPYVLKTTFSYISPESSQAGFLSALNYSYSGKPQIAVLLRISERETYFKWHSWASPASYENVESFLMNVASGRTKLSTSAKFAELSDEEAPGFIVRTLTRAWESFTDSIFVIFDWISWMFHSEDGFIMMSVLFMMIFIFGGSLVSAFSSVTSVPAGNSNYQRRTLNKYSSQSSTPSSTSYRLSGGGEKYYSGRNDSTLRHRKHEPENEELFDEDDDEEVSNSPSSASQASSNGYGDVGNSCFSQ
ncbi:dnaJ homolog subfamily C member 16-like [Convolutriloba macropyga]|uniref:dnaJ homolog subfamily C member 16-like n=1 Tax=Convolutriloba macropyga TaxID=536237 RepID=UPI003F52807E